MRSKCNPSASGRQLLTLVALLLAASAALLPNAVHGQTRHRGIDVSRYQDSIDWKKVAKDSTIRFVYIKATEGASYRDPRYEENILRARKAGLPVGSYHVYNGNTTPQQQIANFKAVAKKRQQDLIPVLDIEASHAGRLNMDRVDKLLALMEAEYGVKPMIYTSENLFTLHFSGKKYAAYHMFIANYKQHPNTRYTLWQYTQTGRCSGIRGNVDFSRLGRGRTLSEIKMTKPSKTDDDATSPATAQHAMVEFVRGLQVSKAQGNIDWTQVSSDTSIKFVYVKATEGTSGPDPNHAENLFRAHRAGLAVGSYHVYSDKATPEQQMAAIRNAVKQRQQDLLPALYIASANGRLNLDRINRLLDLMEAEYEAKPVIYTTESLFKTYFNSKRHFDYPVFFANYTGFPSRRASSWQYTLTGRCYGIAGNVSFLRLHRSHKLDELRMARHTAAPPAASAATAPQPANFLRGLQVSKEQGTVDWGEVAKDASIKFVYVKATEGTSGCDPNHAENLFRARRAGLLVGSYHVYSDKATAERQMAEIRNAVKLRQQDLLPVLFISSASGRLNIERVNALLNLMETEYGVKPAICTSESLYKTYFNGKRHNAYPIFFSGRTGSASGRITMWRYTLTAQCNGIDSDVPLFRLHQNHSLDELKLPKKK